MVGQGFSSGNRCRIREPILQFDLSLGELSTLRECTTERDVDHRRLRNFL